MATCIICVKECKEQLRLRKEASIVCGGCEKWTHVYCAGIKYAMLDEIEDYRCHRCVQDALTPLTSPTHMEGRPVRYEDVDVESGHEYNDEEDDDKEEGETSLLEQSTTSLKILSKEIITTLQQMDAASTTEKALTQQENHARAVESCKTHLKETSEVEKLERKLTEAQDEIKMLNRIINKLIKEFKEEIRNVHTEDKKVNQKICSCTEKTIESTKKSGE